MDATKCEGATPITYKSILEVLKERGATHGDFVVQSGVAQRLKEIVHEYTSEALHPIHMEALEMICVKMARILCGNVNEIDHWRDIAGYAQLVVRELEKK